MFQRLLHQHLWWRSRGRTAQIYPIETIVTEIKESTGNDSSTVPIPGVILSDAPEAGPAQITILSGRLWDNGQTLRVNSKTSTDFQKRKVKQYAVEWTKHANLKFEFDVEDKPDILIDFDPKDGSWSYIGTICREKIGEGKVSMNLGNVNERAKEHNMSQDILHEFGHALGAIHEHQNPLISIPWNKEVVYKALGGPPNGWDRQKVETNMFMDHTAKIVKADKFDPKSIMLYQYPPEWTTDGKGTTLNTELSREDKRYIRSCYPGAGTDGDVEQPNAAELWSSFLTKFTEDLLQGYKEQYGVQGVRALLLMLRRLGVNEGERQGPT